MDKTKAKLTALLDDPFAGYGMNENQKNAATWGAFGYSQSEIAKLMNVARQSVNQYQLGARKKMGLDNNRDFTKYLIKQIKVLLET